MRRADLAEKRFGRWTVVAYAGCRRWTCRCECGVTRNVAGYTLTAGSSASCGCLKIENQTSHGKHDTPEYTAWAAMKSRCSNKRDKFFSDYGGRGISVCERWLTFENFYADMGPRPSDRHSLERRDNDLGYSPDNCYWATAKQQQRNTRRNRIVNFRGQRMSLAAAAEIVGIKYTKVTNRIWSGWSITEALTP